MKYARPEEVGRVETPHGIEARRIHENDHVQVMYLKLAPGEALKPHTTPVDVFFYVLEGRGEVSIGAEARVEGLVVFLRVEQDIGLDDLRDLGEGVDEMR